MGYRLLFSETVPNFQWRPRRCRSRQQAKGSFADSHLATVDPSTGDGTGIDGTTNRNFSPIFSGQVNRQLDQLWLSGPRGGLQRERTENWGVSRPNATSARRPRRLRSQIFACTLEHMTREADDSLIHGAARRAGSRDPDSG